MKFLIDAQLPPGLAKWLAARGHDAEHVHSAMPGATPDAETAAHVEKTGAILISKDEDFLTLRRPDRFALLWLRCGNTTNRALGIWLDQRWPEVERLLADSERFIELR